MSLDDLSLLIINKENARGVHACPYIFIINVLQVGMENQ